MRYSNIEQGIFLERPNRFIAYIELQGRREKVHVKNTGRCAELLRPGARVYVHRSANPNRSTKWDLVAVEKGEKLINMDSQVPNMVVKEWLEQGHLFGQMARIRPETTYKNSRFDFYIEAGDRKIFIEVKGVTLEENGVCKFPDAPSERAVKHLRELCAAVEEGFEAYVLFVIQMKDVRYFTPNSDTHLLFAETLKQAEERGVHILAYDCNVGKDQIEIRRRVPVFLGNFRLKEAAQPIIDWYKKYKRNLPWREEADAYHVWVSEIMLQQTRVEAVKPYYERFVKELPNIKALAEAQEERLLKLWEGLGYYSRVRNMQIAAKQMMEKYGGEFPHSYEEIRALKGVGNYTAGAISSFAYGIAKPAVDGNVLRVISRLLANGEDIMRASVRKKIEQMVEEVIPSQEASDFNQGLIEIGAIVCLPNGEPKCERCPLNHICLAYRDGNQMDFPVKKKSRARKTEERTVLIFRDNDTVAIRRRPEKGLLAGLYEFPSVKGHLDKKEVIEYSSSIGLSPIRLRELGEAKHIFSHIEWHMTGYEVIVDELEKNCREDMLFAGKDELEQKYPIPSAFEAYRNIGW